ncbi:hypothetical protein QQP08_010624 [Theobroma cacao]|nr:hypothetical protein QQP08_010624 [Theobroma cacao]
MVVVLLTAYDLNPNLCGRESGTPEIQVFQTKPDVSSSLLVKFLSSSRGRNLGFSNYGYTQKRKPSQKRKRNAIQENDRGGTTEPAQIYHRSCNHDARSRIARRIHDVP